MTVLASAVLARVRYQLVDSGLTLRWTDAELLQWLSEGQRAIVMALPEATQTVVALPLVAGTKQSLPVGAHILLHVYRNLTALGVAGPACLQVDMSMMDTQYPTWHTDPATLLAGFYVYNRLPDPTVFYVYPPNLGGGSLEINYSVLPVDLPLVTSPLTVRDIYQTALVDFVLYKSHSKDSDYAAGQQMAAAYYQAFAVEVQSQGGGK